MKDRLIEAGVTSFSCEKTAGVAIMILQQELSPRAQRSCSGGHVMFCVQTGKPGFRTLAPARSGLCGASLRAQLADDPVLALAVERVPPAAAVQGSQPGHRICANLVPAAPRARHTVSDHMPTGPLDGG